MVVVVMGVGGKDAIFAAAINCLHHQQCRNQRNWLNHTATTINDDHYRQLPPLTTAIAAAAQSTFNNGGGLC
jgi:hypothetical protein